MAFHQPRIYNQYREDDRDTIHRNRVSWVQLEHQSHDGDTSSRQDERHPGRHSQGATEGENRVEGTLTAPRKVSSDETSSDDNPFTIPCSSTLEDSDDEVSTDGSDNHTRSSEGLGMVAHPAYQCITAPLLCRRKQQ